MSLIAEATGQLTRKEFLRAIAWSHLKGPQKWWLLWWGIPLLAFVLFWWQGTPVTEMPLLATLVVGAPILGLGAEYWQFHKAEFKTGQWQFFDEHILLNWGKVESRVPWDLILRFVETQQCFYLFFSKKCFYILPKRCFSSEEKVATVRAKIQGEIAAKARESRTGNAAS